MVLWLFVKLVIILGERKKKKNVLITTIQVRVKPASFFWISLSYINKAKKHNFKYGIYCSSKCIRKNGMSGRKWGGRRRGENNPNCVLNDNLVKFIKISIKNGDKIASISKLYNVNPSTIYAIKENKAWTHILIE